MSSVLKLQNFEATASLGNAAVVSLTSSASNCCKDDSEPQPE
ncbi:class III lanthipeptide [Streptomyces sp. NPDC004327]